MTRSSEDGGEKTKSAFALLKEHGLSPKKRLGQNFLVDANISRKIAVAATTPAAGTVLEIGPGLGALTVFLLERAARVVVIERDEQLVPVLRAELAAPIEAGKLTVNEGDGLAFDWTAALEDGPRPHSVAGNLPYLLTGRFLERVTEHAKVIDRAVFMVQLEVADRLLASPATKEYGALTVFVRAAFDVERLVIVRKGCFHPRPEVDSAVVVLSPRAKPVAETQIFRELVKAAFGMRRKTLRNAWRATTIDFEAIERAATSTGIDLGRRGETLSVEEFHQVSSHIERATAHQAE